MKIRNAAWKIENSRTAKYVGHFGGLKIVEFESLGEWDSFYPSQGVKIMRRSSLSFLQITSLEGKKSTLSRSTKKMGSQQRVLRSIPCRFFGTYIGTYQTLVSRFVPVAGGSRLMGVVGGQQRHRGQQVRYVNSKISLNAPEVINSLTTHETTFMKRSLLGGSSQLVRSS